VLEELAGQSVDELLVLGDTVLKLGDSAAALRLLGAVPHRALYGNMEWAVLAGWSPAWPSPWGQPLDAARSFSAAEVLDARRTLPLGTLRRQPSTIALDTPVGRLLACHGTPRSCFGLLLPTPRPGDPPSPWRQDDAQFAGELGDVAGCAVVACAHIHVPYARRSGDVLVVNPGAVGWSREEVDDPFKARYALLTLERGREPAVAWRTVRYDNARAVGDLRAKQARVEAELADDGARAASRAWHDHHARLIGG
jgi:hypothetical protein